MALSGVVGFENENIYSLGQRESQMAVKSEQERAENKYRGVGI